MTIKIVARYARRRRDDREVYRQAVLTVKLPKDKSQHPWHQAVLQAMGQLRQGERLVSLSEAGYQ